VGHEAEPQDDAPLVLVVDDEPDGARLVCRWLEDAGFRARVHGSAESFLDGLETSLPDAVCLDIGLPGLDGLEALELVRKRHADVPVLMLTANSTVDTVVRAMQRGAVDYLAKPVDEIRLITAVHNAVERARAQPKSAELLHASETGRYAGIVGVSPAIREVFRQLDRVSSRDISVLIHGESGTGKELVARAIHERSARAKGPFVAVNCGAIPETLQDSELFGHEKGAFTGASSTRQGRFEQADGGTLFLDEVAELSAQAQAKLLRVLQEHAFERVGGTRTIRSNFRLLAASHKSLRKLVREGAFREDLFFRIAVFELELPALRERPGDVELLVSALLTRAAQRHGGEPLRVSEQALACLRGYAWPGNVRELSNVLERASVVADGGMIQAHDLPAHVRSESASTKDASRASAQPAARVSAVESAPAQPKKPVDASLNLEELERWAIEQALAQAQGNIAEVVKKLGMGKTTLYRKLKKYGIR
jgi:DNA-binding NtrC family response regulator